MFFTREGASLSLVGSYRGTGAFLIGAGPSFAVVDKARLGRVWAMTLNNACASWRGQGNCTVDEPSRFSLSMWLDPTVQKFVPMGHFEKPLWDNRLLREEGASEHSLRQQWEQAAMKLGDCPNVIGYRRNEKFHAPRFLYEETVNWGNHKKYGGGRSVLLAALRILFLLGFRRVYLLGGGFRDDAGAEVSLPRGTVGGGDPEQPAHLRAAPAMAWRGTAVFSAGKICGQKLQPREQADGIPFPAL